MDGHRGFLHPLEAPIVANHAEDQYLFFDVTFAPLIAKLAPQTTTVTGVVAMTARAHMPALDLPNLHRYEERIGAARRVRLAAAGREHGLTAVLHLGHYGSPEGRAVLALFHVNQRTARRR